MLVKYKDQCKAKGPHGVKCQRGKGHPGNHMHAKGANPVHEWQNT